MSGRGWTLVADGKQQTTTKSVRGQASRGLLGASAKEGAAGAGWIIEGRADPQHGWALVAAGARLEAEMASSTPVETGALAHLVRACRGMQAGGCGKGQKQKGEELLRVRWERLLT